MKKILAVDIDETCVDVIPTHLDWCNIFSGKSLTHKDIGYDYNLEKYFPELEGVMDFWSTPNLYQKLKPKDGCMETLKILHNMGWKIGFTTYAKKGHFSSKCEWIKKNFPFYSFINASKEKGYTLCTHFVDDRNKHLNQMPSDVVLIKMETPHWQDEELNRDAVLVNSWWEVGKVLGVYGEDSTTINL